MTETSVIELMKEVLILIIMLSSPILLVTLTVGILISILQAVTQIQEATLTFVPKIMAAFAILIITAPWMINVFMSHTQHLFQRLPELVR